MALDELASAWIGADSTRRREITAATNAIDAQLRSDPFGSSESREDDIRIMFADSLGILFVVNLTERTARYARLASAAAQEMTRSKKLSQAAFDLQNLRIAR
jgi:hypothetical protein